MVGSGPAGLACAQQLNRAGHSVTVYERDEKPGGLLRYGIPDFKLDKSIIDRRLDILNKEGITFRCNVEVGKDITAEELKEKYDISNNYLNEIFYAASEFIKPEVLTLSIQAHKFMELL